MAHANTLKKNANAGDVLSKISLQLWNFASKKLNLPVPSVPTVTLGPGVTPPMAHALLNLPRGTDTTASAGQYQMTSSNYFGGLVRKAYGGVVPGFTSQGVGALLHGGEYVVNAKAVKNIGYATLEALNNMRYATPGKMSGPAGTVINETQNVNIYVDTFIGQEQWFESMMKEYNVKVVPRNQKKAGLENRTISTYSGINRGM
jgi:hypothetical protein